MKLLISVDGKSYEVEVEVAEDDYAQQMQDNRPAPTSMAVRRAAVSTSATESSRSAPTPREKRRRGG